MNVTVDDVMALKPCYSREHVTRLFAGRPHVSAADIASATISYDDRAWLLLRLAPREAWLPAVYRAAERAIRHAAAPRTYSRLPYKKRIAGSGIIREDMHAAQHGHTRAGRPIGC